LWKDARAAAEAVATDDLCRWDMLSCVLSCIVVDLAVALLREAIPPETCRGPYWSRAVTFMWMLAVKVVRVWDRIVPAAHGP